MVEAGDFRFGEPRKCCVPSSSLCPQQFPVNEQREAASRSASGGSGTMGSANMFNFPDRESKNLLVRRQQTRFGAPIGKANVRDDLADVVDTDCIKQDRVDWHVSD